MRCIEVKSQPYCIGCPMESLSIIGASAVCDNAVICDRLSHWMKDGKKYLTAGPVQEEEPVQEKERTLVELSDDYTFIDDVKYNDIEDLL